MDYRGDQVDNMIQRERLTAEDSDRNASVLAKRREEKLKLAKLWREDYTFSDLTRELEARGSNYFESLHAAEQWFVERLLKVIRVIEWPKKHVVFKNSKSHRAPTPLTVFLSSYNERMGNSFSYPLGDIITRGSYFRFITQYRLFAHANVDFYPYSAFEEDPTELDVLNSFIGFEVKPVPLDQVDESVISRILYHLKEVLCAGDEKIYRYIVGWFGRLFKYPRRHLPMIVFYGRQGTGKTCFVEKLINERIFGVNMVAEATSIKDITKEFNAKKEDKVLIYLREIAAEDESHSKNRSNMNEMKDMITDSRSNVNRKGIEEYTKNNFNHFIGTTNHEISMRFDDDQRRFFVTEVSDKHKGDDEYFDALIKSFTPEAASHFYSWCVKQLDSDWLEGYNPEKFPITKTMQAIILASKHSAELFVYEVQTGETTIKIPSYHAESQLEVEGHTWFCPKIYIYSSYTDWCKASGCKAYSRSWFFRNAGKTKPWGEEKKRQNKGGYFIPIKQISVYHAEKVDIDHESMTVEEFRRFNDDKSEKLLGL